MLAKLVERPFHKPGWVYEEKYDGIRILAYKEGNRISLLTRNGKERRDGFPEIAAAIARLQPVTLLLDGEALVFDSHGVSRFQLLQRDKGRPRFAAFDCLYLNGQDLRNQTLAARREALERVVRPTEVLMISARLAEDGCKAFQIAKRRKLEGLIAKNPASVYSGKRSREWLKVKVNHEDEFVIGGFTPPTGSRKHLGALLLGVYKGDKLLYAGKVGTGFDQDTLASLHRQFRTMVRGNSPFASRVREKNATFVSPKLVAQISFTEWTGDGKLRHPVYLGLRDDIEARDVTRPGAIA